jgi:hypothetical protein
MAQDRLAEEPVSGFPETEATLNQWLVADSAPAVFRVAPPSGANIKAKFRPFYAIGESYPYRMYFDLDKPPAA